MRKTLTGAIILLAILATLVYYLKTPAPDPQNPNALIPLPTKIPQQTEHAKMISTQQAAVQQSRDYAAPFEKPSLVPPNGQPYWDMFFKDYGVNPFVSTEDEQFSTFGMDVDTGSYTVMRGYLQKGSLPPKESVRTEEYINYFKQDYTATKDTFAINIDGAKSKFGDENKHLIRIGILAKDIPLEKRKPAVITFVVDISGSMSIDSRLGLVKKSIKLLTDHLKSEDKIGLAVYGTQGRKILEPTNNKEEVIRAVESLTPEGSTNAEQGIKIGYEMAGIAFEEGKINRVILMSDGVANIGVTDADTLLKHIKQQAKKGLTLSTIGFGMGNYNDVLMEQLADHGDGQYAYIDTYNEARKLFGNGLTGLLEIVASDAKVQVEFNPNVVDRYRLIGYENRHLNKEDFRNNSIDAGEIGAGHTVTALYEVRLKDNTSSVGTVRIRYADPQTGNVNEIEKEIKKDEVSGNFETASARFRLTAAVAEFAEILKESYWAKDGKLDDVLNVAESALDDMTPTEEDREFVTLIKNAIDIKRTD